MLPAIPSAEVHTLQSFGGQVVDLREAQHRPFAASATAAVLLSRIVESGPPPPTGFHTGPTGGSVAPSGRVSSSPKPHAAQLLGPLPRPTVRNAASTIVVVAIAPTAADEPWVDGFRRSVELYLDTRVNMTLLNRSVLSTRTRPYVPPYNDLRFLLVEVNVTTFDGESKAQLLTDMANANDTLLMAGNLSLYMIEAFGHNSPPQELVSFAPKRAPAEDLVSPWWAVLAALPGIGVGTGFGIALAYALTAPPRDAPQQLLRNRLLEPPSTEYI
jgi:hypothetical protein